MDRIHFSLEFQNGALPVVRVVEQSHCKHGGSPFAGNLMQQIRRSFPSFPLAYPSPWILRAQQFISGLWQGRYEHEGLGGIENAGDE